MTITLDQVVFIGFNKRVVALDQNTGQVVWDWTCPTGSGYVSLLLTDDRHLIVSVSGYTYCLDPATGQSRRAGMVQRAERLRRRRRVAGVVGRVQCRASDDRRGRRGSGGSSDG